VIGEVDAGELVFGLGCFGFGSCRPGLRERLVFNCHLAAHLETASMIACFVSDGVFGELDAWIAGLKLKGG
jgi:hypothetical protein